MTFAIGIDLGGTNMRAGLVSADGKILKITKRKTPVAEGPEATANGMNEMISEVKSGTPEVAGVGIGSPGPLSRHEKKIFQTPNLPGFDGYPLGQKVAELSKFTVELDNDAKCATYGEGMFGAAQGVKNYILMTFGTGIGGGIIENGQMIYGKSDGACELGHFTLYPEGRPCKCGNRGCFEQYVAATAVERRASEAAGRHVNTFELFSAFGKGEAWATQCLKAVSLDLAIATASLVNIFDPEAIVFGGGLFTDGGGPLCEWVQNEIKTRCFASSQKGLKIFASKLHGDAGVLGAASLILRKSKHL